MIPIARPDIGSEEAEAVKEVLQSGWVTQGPKVAEFEKSFAAYVGAKHACAVSSCTSALHLALLAVGVKPGDAVITVSHSFIATANAVRHCGAEPVFLDIEPDTYNMSTAELKKCLESKCKTIDGELFYNQITGLATGESPLTWVNRGRQGRIAAILPVHQMGMPCDIEAIVALAKKYNIPVVEDAACAIGSEINLQGEWHKIGKPHGDIACFSFHPRKVITTGDGGMLTTRNPEFDTQFRLLRQQGMELTDSERHNAEIPVVEHYSRTAYNYRMTDIQASVGIEQLKKLPGMLDQRTRLDALYREHLKGLDWLELPVIPISAKTNWQSYPVKIRQDAPLSRDDLIMYLAKNQVSTKPGIMNAHAEKPYVNTQNNLPHSESCRADTLLLPFYNHLQRNDIGKIADLLKKL